MLINSEFGTQTSASRLHMSISDDHCLNCIACCPLVLTKWLWIVWIVFLWIPMAGTAGPVTFDLWQKWHDVIEPS